MHYVYYKRTDVYKRGVFIHRGKPVLAGETFTKM